MGSGIGQARDLAKASRLPISTASWQTREALALDRAEKIDDEQAQDVLR